MITDRPTVVAVPLPPATEPTIARLAHGDVRHRGGASGGAAVPMHRDGVQPVEHEDHTATAF